MAIRMFGGVPAPQWVENAWNGVMGVTDTLLSPFVSRPVDDGTLRHDEKGAPYIREIGRESVTPNDPAMDFEWWLVLPLAAGAIAALVFWPGKR